MTACNTHQPLGVTEDETAFQKAAARNDTKFMQQSLEAQESQDSGCCCLPLTRKNRQQNINDDAQCSALVQAAKRGAYEAVKFLLERGVNVNTPVAIPFDFEEGSYRTTALMQAAENGHASIVEILLEHDADPNLQTAGDTALMWTAKYGHVACVTALLTGGATPDFQNEDGRTALMVAALNGQKASVSALLAGKANPDIQDKEGRTALMLAAKEGHEAILAPIVGILLAGKANPDIQDDRDETALMKAAFKNYVDVVSTLLKHGADTTLVDIDKVGAAGHGSAEVQAMIIANQLNIFKRKPKSGSYPSPDEGSSRRRRNQHKDTPQGRRGS